MCSLTSVLSIPRGYSRLESRRLKVIGNLRSIGDLNFLRSKGSLSQDMDLDKRFSKSQSPTFLNMPHLHNHLSPTWESCIFIIRRVGRCDMDGSRSACYIPINGHSSPGVFQGSVQGLYEAKSSSKRQVPEIEILNLLQPVTSSYPPLRHLGKSHIRDQQSL